MSMINSDILCIFNLPHVESLADKVDEIINHFIYNIK